MPLSPPLLDELPPLLLPAPELDPAPELEPDPPPELPVPDDEPAPELLLDDPPSSPASPGELLLPEPLPQPAIEAETPSAIQARVSTGSLVMGRLLGEASSYGRPTALSLALVRP
jgi:hypothetical protein